jgi:phosphatidylinositol kinase/protein kinase (PI-3  family)
MFSAGLSPTLVDALTDLSIHIPLLLPSIQERLLTSIGIILDGGSGKSVVVRDVRRNTSFMTSMLSRTHTRSASTSPAESKYGPDPAVTELLQLALATLAKFDFSSHNLLPFVRDVVMAYLDHDQPLIRQQAAITCSALILPLKRRLKEKKSSADRHHHGHNHHSAGADSKERKEKEWLAREREWKELKEKEARGEIKAIGDDDDAPLVDVDEDADLLTIKRSSVSAICEILERLLTVGIADSDPLIRRTVLEALDSRFDHFLAQAENLHFLFVALNDEVFAIREAAISVIGRLAVRNPAYVMPPLRKTLIQLLTELQYSGDGSKREESAKLLGHLIAHSRRLMKPYVGPILRVLIPKLRGDPNVATAALSTLGRLSTIGGDDMVEHLDQLMPIIIGTLQDKSSMVKREVALRTLGELVESTGYVIEPYLRYRDLLPTVLAILKSGQLPVVRREVVKVLGIIGALDPFKHKMNQLSRRTDRSKKGNLLTGNGGNGNGGKTEASPKKAGAAAGAAGAGGAGAAAGNNGGEGKEGGALDAGAAAGAGDSHPGLTHFSDDYFPTVAINALMRILKDSSLTTHHNKVIGAVMFIFRSLGMRCVPFLPQIIPPFLAVMRSSEESVRESLFKELGVLVTIVKSNIRNYLDGIFALIHEYWKDTNLLSEQILVLLEIISLALRDEFKIYLPDLLPQLLTILHTDRTEKRIPTNKVLHALETFGANLDDYLHLIVPAMVKLFEQPDSPLAVRQRAVFTVGALCRQLPMGDYASRILHPLARVIEVHSARLTSPTNTKTTHTLSPLCEEAMNTLCIIVCQLGPAYAIFVPMYGKLFQRQQIKHDLYDSLIGKIVAGVTLEMKDLPPPPISTARTNSLGAQIDAKEFGVTFEGVATGPHEKLQVNQLNLKKTWETSARSTRDDWMDWYRIFSIELLKESPSPALRACSTLAQKYHPLARELFNAAFVSCWTELHDMAQDDLVRSLEFAFKAPSIPADLLQTLLNLAEFMEHDSKPLPIDISTLGLLAEKCHAYAKALHYKELEFRLDPSNTIEALISINNQLQQPDAAVGILVYAKHHHSLELRESWYEKLQRWEDALEAYERRQLEAADNVEFTLGRMRCLRALGEWERLAALGSDLWTRSSDSVRRDVAPLAAAAAWNLGQWELMPQYLSSMDEGKSESEFFRALLSVHRRQFPEARRHIDRTRVLLETELTALVGESYNRAYRVMVQVQQMAELEEIIRYKECRDPEQKALIRKMWTSRLKGCQRDVDVWQQILAVRSIVVSPKEDIPTWLNFSSLCRKSGRYAMSLKVLTSLFTFDPHKVMPTATSSPTLTLPSSPNPSTRGIGLSIATPVSPGPVRKPSLTSTTPGAPPIPPSRGSISSVSLSSPLPSSPVPPAGSTTPTPPGAGFVMSPGRVVTAVAGTTKPPPIPPYHSSNAPATLSSGPMSPSHAAHHLSIHKGKNNYYYGYTSDTPLPKQYPQVSFAYLKHLWAAGFHDEAFKKMGVLVQQLEEKTRVLESSSTPRNFASTPISQTSGFTSASSLSILNLSSPTPSATPLLQSSSWSQSNAIGVAGASSGTPPELDAAELLHLKARCYLRLGDWQLSMHDRLDNDLIPQVLNSFHRATLCDAKSYKVWHGFAVMNFRIVSHYSQLKQAAVARQTPAERKAGESKRPDVRLASSRPSLSGTSSSTTSSTSVEIAELQRKIDAHVVPGINGFFRSIALAGDQSLQDILRLLTLWFSHGSHPDAETALRRGFNTISIDTWLAVIPQIIARIHTSHLPMIDELLQKIGRAHPQALVYSLTVASKSASVPRRVAATNILNKLREHSPVLVEQSAMVSHELIRVAILWHEMWHEALEEASRLWFGQRNVDAMFQTLAPLHEMMADGPQTLREVSFMQNYGRDLQEAYEWCQKYKRFNKESDLNQAWDLYCSVFRLVNKQLTGLADLELQYVSPKLLAARDLELAVPGTYLRDDSRGAVDPSQIIHIGSFVPSLRVIESKQRPRKLQIRGGDGQDYAFLLKGHEDLRQDKRVMQLFGLVNTLLANDNDTAKKDLKIRAYSVIPLAPNSGLIQWMQNCDTLHALIKDYRDARRVLLNIEHRLMLQMAPDYLSLTQMQKVEVFEFALARTTGTLRFHLLNPLIHECH